MTIIQKGEKMSIIVEKAESYRCCNSCGSNDRVLNITTLIKVGHTKQGAQIAVCNDCAKDLLDSLRLMVRRAERREE